MRKLFSLLVLCGVLVFAVSAKAQQTLGSLNGTVIDPSNAAVAGATVTATDPDINVTRTTKTQGNGFFQIFNLPVGTYSVKAERDGFETTNLSGITVQEARATTVPVTLKVGEVSTTVEVIANPLLNATDATNGYTLDSTADRDDSAGDGKLYATGGAFAGRECGTAAAASTPMPDWGTRHLGEWTTRHVEHVSGEWRGRDQHLQRQSSSGRPRSDTTSTSAGAARRARLRPAQGTMGGASQTGTSVYGSNGNSLPSPPPEFLQELRVNTSMYDAQQGATSGAQIDANTTPAPINPWAVVWELREQLAECRAVLFQAAVSAGTQGVGRFSGVAGQSRAAPLDHGRDGGGPVFKNKLFFFAAYQHMYASDQSTGLRSSTCRRD